MITKNVFKVLVLFVSFCIPGLGNAQIDIPKIQINRVEVPPVVDGNLEDASWKKSYAFSDFIIWTLDNYVKDSVQVFLCYDNVNLYVAFRSKDSLAGKLNKKVNPRGSHDTFLWGKDFVMVGIQSKDGSYQVMGDPKGTMTDFKNNNIMWNGKWQYAALINKEDWSAEFSIPLKEFGLTDLSENKEFTIDLSRSFPEGESAQWNGKCVLSNSNNLQYQFGRWQEPVPDKNFLSFRATNSGNTQQNLKCELKLIPLKDKPEFINQAGQSESSTIQLKYYTDPLFFKSSFIISPGGVINESILYELPVEGSYYASLIVKSENDSILYRGHDFSFTIEPNREKIQGCIERIGESVALMNRLSNPLVSDLKAKAAKTLSKLKHLAAFADTAWKMQKWDELTTMVQNADREVSQLRHTISWAGLHNWQVADDFGIGITHSVLKLRKDALFPKPISDQANISLAANEYESFQITILPFGKDLNQLTLKASDLISKNGNVIKDSNIEISLVGYNNIKWQAAYVASYKGWHPDPLMPISSTAKIAGDEICRPIWITIYAPPGTKPGEYNGTVTIAVTGMKKITAYINCRVRNFELPTASHLKTHTWDELSNMKDFYNLDQFPVEWYQRHCELLLKNRLNPGNAGINFVNDLPNSAGEYDFSKVEKVLRFCIEKGLTRFTILQMKKGSYTKEEAEKTYKFVAAYAKFLRKKGWLDKALVELWDEPTDLEWPLVKERAERLRVIDPGLRLQLFAEGGPYDFWDPKNIKFGWKDLIDIWAPINIIEAPQVQAKGGEIWAYYCTLARGNAPNFYIDCPAIYQRSIAWYSWMYGLDCFEHWGTNYIWRNVRTGQPMDKKWPNVEWDSRTYHFFNGEGQLVYPGPKGIPYSSIRLENFRDGMDDYEYLFKLKELLSVHDKESSDSRFNEYRKLLYPENYLLHKYPRQIKVSLENTLRYPEDPEHILEVRNKIAEAIESIQKH